MSEDVQQISNEELAKSRQKWLEEALAFDEASPMNEAKRILFTLAENLGDLETLSHHQTHLVLQAIQLLQTAVRPAG